MLKADLEKYHDFCMKMQLDFFFSIWTAHWDSNMTDILLV